MNLLSPPLVSISYFPKEKNFCYSFQRSNPFSNLYQLMFPFAEFLSLCWLLSCKENEGLSGFDCYSTVYDF